MLNKGQSVDRLVNESTLYLVNNNMHFICF